MHPKSKLTLYEYIEQWIDDPNGGQIEISNRDIALDSDTIHLLVNTIENALDIIENAQALSIELTDSDKEFETPEQESDYI